ncbi:MAG: fluoride efflux transporter CrcB [Arcobacteraceae bacterium]|jgi:CrcB protein|nr:fluoride efflux transporter CrcB [Arcobacteraceae bacterium]
MNFTWQNIIAVGFGGFLGATTRFYINIFVGKNFPHELPLATLSVNVAGSFLIGLLIGLFLYFTPYEWMKLFLITGFLGALTTYSTFAIETFFLLQSSFWMGILNIVLNLIGSIGAVALGYKLMLYFLR